MLSNAKNLSISSIRDTISSKYHSKDFIFARSEYLRSRIATICAIFIVLTPFWTLFDLFLLPTDTLPIVLSARVIMFLGLIATWYSSSKSQSTTRLNLLLSGLTLSLLGLFYAAVLISLTEHIPSPLIGYSFIPFLLVATLGIFPFTLIESFSLGFGLLCLQFFSAFITGTSFSYQSLQDLWLLAALLCIVMTTNHFHLSLLRLYRQATHDPLTGLLNRVALERRTAHIENQTVRPATAITLLDLDHFKRINDQYGHSVGDEVLRAFAALIKQEIKSTDITCRYGGEEFLIICTGLTKEQAINQAERIRSKTEQLRIQTLEHNAISITISLGLSMLKPKERVTEAIQRADECLYLAKRTGRNRLVAEEV